MHTHKNVYTILDFKNLPDFLRLYLSMSIAYAIVPSSTMQQIVRTVQLTAAYIVNKLD